MTEPLNGRENIEGVLFDLDDTLHDDTLAFTSAAEEVAREVAAERGVDALALKSAYVAQVYGFWHQLTAQQLQEKLSAVRVRLWADALRSMGLDDESLAREAAAAYHQRRKKFWSPFPAAVDLLRDLKRRGKRLGILTNGVSETHREKIAMLRISEYFDAIFFADEVGMVKPDPLLFAHACRRLGCAPSRTAMVGDRYERDIAGALQAGLFAVWVNVRGEALPAGATPPHATVPSIAQAGEHL